MSMTRRFTVSSLMATALVLSSVATVQAQEMTDAERGVWEWEMACWGASDTETTMDCFHDDYVGWAGGATVPLTKAHRRPFTERGFETSETVFYHLIPMSVTQRDLANAIHVPYQRINEIVNGKRGVTPRTALRQARFFGTSEDFWINLQLRCDLYAARRAEEAELKTIQQHVHAA